MDEQRFDNLVKRVANTSRRQLLAHLLGGLAVVAEVNEHGVQEFERIVTESFDDIRAACIGYLEHFFQEHPEVAARAHLIRPIVNQPVLEDDGEFA